jgi:hypothetical protein
MVLGRVSYEKWTTYGLETLWISKQNWYYKRPEYAQCSSALLGDDDAMRVFDGSSQPEVGDLGLEVLVEQDVAGFDVSVDDPGLG